jgi:type I restriction enzyme, R subunit
MRKAGQCTGNSALGSKADACAFTYRLIKYAGAKRILFLVDRANLGRQAAAEFQQFVTPDTNRKFTELYNVQHLTSNALDPVCRVTICTIQRLYSMLRGEELDEDLDEKSGFEIAAPCTFFTAALTNSASRKAC